MTITKNINGSITLSELIRGYLVSRTYFGYTVREAKKLFWRDVG